MGPVQTHALGCARPFQPCSRHRHFRKWHREMPRNGHAGDANPSRQMPRYQPGLPRSGVYPSTGFCQSRRRWNPFGSQSRRTSLSIEPSADLGGAGVKLEIMSTQMDKGSKHLHGILLVAICTLAWFAFPAAAASLSLSWTNNLLTISGPNLAGGKLDVWYLEAFCRKGATDRDWNKTVLPHKTSLLSAKAHYLRFLTKVESNIEMRHEIRARTDEVEFRFELENHSDQAVDLDWFEPACIRVDRFTGLDQTNYISK